MKDESIRRKAYRVWENIKKRCYNPKDRSYPSYGGAGVVMSDDCRDNSASFVKWYVEHYYECEGGVNIDKDVLGGGIYSAETCIMIPAKINMSLPKKPRVGDTHTGVQMSGKKYEVKVRNVLNGSKNEYVGTFKTMDDALEAYVECKKSIFKLLVESYKDEMPSEVYTILIKYTEEIKA